MSLEKQNENEEFEQKILHLMLHTDWVWKAASIDDQPEVTIHHWAIKQTDRGEYFVGTTNDGNGRVSTQIMEFDKEKMVGRTKSGRVYHLVGKAGYSSNGEYVWGRYKVANQLTEVEIPSQ